MNEIIISYPRLLIKVECPRCKDRYDKLIRIHSAKCKKCNFIFDPDLKAHIPAMFAYLIQRMLAENNEIKIYGEIKYKNEIFEIYKMYSNMGCYQIDSPKVVEKMNTKFRCAKCGFCTTCITCAKCGSLYTSDKKRCQKCNSQKTTQTHISEINKRRQCRACKNVLPEGMLKCECGCTRTKEVCVCPHCGKTDVWYTAFKNSDTCPMCGTKANVPEKFKDYELCIQRMKAFRIENIALVTDEELLRL